MLLPSNKTESSIAITDILLYASTFLIRLSTSVLEKALYNSVVRFPVTAIASRLAA